MWKLGKGLKIKSHVSNLVKKILSTAITQVYQDNVVKQEVNRIDQDYECLQELVNATLSSMESEISASRSEWSSLD